MQGQSASPIWNTSLILRLHTGTFLESKRSWGGGGQSCKKLGSVVALLQGNFEKSHELKANFERKNTHSFDAITKTLVQLFAIKFNHLTYVQKSKNF